MAWVCSRPRALAVLLVQFGAMLVVSTASILKAQEAAQVPSVSLDRVVQLARQTAPAITAARARAKQAEARTFLGAVPRDPEVTLAGDRAEPSGGGPRENETGFEVTQFLPSPRGVRARLRSGDAGVAAAERDVDSVIADVVFEAKRLYYESAVAQTEAGALAQAASDAHSLMEIMERRVQLGESSEGDRLRTRVEALRTELEARAALSQAEANRAALNRFLLGALGSDFTLCTDLDPTLLPNSRDEAITLAVARNPRYQAALQRVESARWSVSAERASRLPGLSLSFFNDREIDKKAAGFRLGFSVPLWNRNEGSVRLAEAELRELESDSVQLKALIEADTERLVRSAQTAKELAVSYRHEILPAASEALSIVRFSLEQGEANLLSWLESRRSYLEILRASYRAQLDAFARAAELERLLGGIDATN